MPSKRSLALAQRYVAWLRRRDLAIIAVAAVALFAAVYLIRFHLPLKADFSYLLPPDAPAVRDLRKLEARVQSQDTVLAVIASHDPKVRAAAGADLAARIRAMPPVLVATVEDDDAPLRDFLRAHRHLLVPLADLQAADKALHERIAAETAADVPLIIDFDVVDEADKRKAEAAAAQEKADAEAKLAELRKQRDQAMARLDRSGFVSEDGTHQLVVIHTAFSKTDVAHGKQLLDRLNAIGAQVKRAHPGVDLGFTGGVVPTVVEHRALVRGMVLSSVVTAVLVGLVLLLYFRSAQLLVILGVVLVVAVMVGFGVAAFTVGHLNAATAFLGAIIAGNGVNYGILLIGRYLEVRRRRPSDAAMAEAIAGTIRPTLVASLGAAIAYGSLAATSFRGFADFAVIGSVGMLLCWVASYTLLPVLMQAIAGRIREPRGRPLLGNALAWLLAFRHPGRVVAAIAVLAIGGGIVTYRYIQADPFEYDIKNLRSDGDDAIEARRWIAESDRYFGRGITNQTFIAVDAPGQVGPVVAALARENQPGKRPVIGTVRSIQDLIPPDQDARIAALNSIREAIDNPVLEALDEHQLAELRELRPPDQIDPISVKDLPPSLAESLRERDGRIGLLIGVRPAPDLDEWNGKDLIRFAAAVRRLDLGHGRTVTTSGPSVIFADIIEAIESDGLMVTAIAAAGITVMVLLVVGRNFRSLAVLLAIGMGALALVAVCALFDLKVNFLDFVALPITLGLGVDYAVNVAHRHHGEYHDPVQTLRTSGSAVFVCSSTTMIGYGSLLVSENLAIRGFGLASLIGEITCLSTALVLVPAVVSLRKRTPSPGASDHRMEAAA